MRKSWGVAIGAAAVALAAFTPGVALAAPPPPPNHDTATTFAVGVAGTLQISAPISANLSSATPVAPGGQVVGSLGVVRVTDLRSVANGSWTASVSSSDYTTGGDTPAETIPATDLAYDPTATLAKVSGTIHVLSSHNVAALSSTPAATVEASGVDGDNQVTWNPVITVSVPGTAVSGIYAGTITHSVL